VHSKIASAMFEFQNPDRLVENDLELVLIEKYPGDPNIGFVPEYKFEMRLTGTEYLHRNEGWLHRVANR
jgi:hypothetical protein